MSTSAPPSKSAVVLTNSFSVEAARLCILELRLENFGSRDSLNFCCETEGVEVRATEILPTSRPGSPITAETAVLVAIRWNVRPSIVRLICRSDKTTAIVGISNLTMSSLPQFTERADGHCLLALANILRPVDSSVAAAYVSVLNRMRKLARRDFFLNWLPAAEDRFVCLVLLAGAHDPGGFRLMPLNEAGAGTAWLSPISYSTADRHIVLLYDTRDVATAPSTPLELAAVIQDRLHVWRLQPGLKARTSAHPDADQPHAISSRWTDRLCETIAAARADLLVRTSWDFPDTGKSTNLKLQAEIDNSILVITDVVDMFSLTMVMAAAEAWKMHFARIFLLLPPGGTTMSESDPISLIEEFGGTGVLEPITPDELHSMLRELEPGTTLSFTSVAAAYDTPIDNNGRTELSMATFDTASPEQLQLLKKIVHYSVIAGSPLVWRELQRSFANEAPGSNSFASHAEGKTASLVDDLYTARCAGMGWPLAALQHFDRQIFTAFRTGDFS